MRALPPWPCPVCEVPWEEGDRFVCDWIKAGSRAFNFFHLKDCYEIHLIRQRAAAAKAQEPKAPLLLRLVTETLGRLGL